ncbi:MAG: hypothetical protein ABL995_07360 [Bryobacteraceae bacterium]
MKKQSRLAILGLLPVLLAPLPVFAQIDLSGDWTPRFHEDQPERIPGPDIGDYAGLPINEAARLAADSFNAARWEMLEYQCRPHPADYMPRGPSALRIWKEVAADSREIVAWHLMYTRSEHTDRIIYMDGRPHPPEWARHTWGGFSTGKWDGNMLTVTTTHLKEGYIRRNGVPRSDMATVTQRFIRHDNWMTVVEVINDPIYLSETFIRTTDLGLDLRQNMAPYPCEPKQVIDRPVTNVPNHLPGTNPFLTEFSSRFNLPPQAARGGPETMYPEYEKKMAGTGTSAKK